MKRDIKRDIKTGTWLLYGLMAVAATGCVREGLETGTRDTVRLTVVGRALETRAVAGSDGSTSFTDGDALSLFMRGTTYANVDNRKVDYSVTGSAGTWKIEGKEILLNDRTAVTSLVFPYSEAAVYNNIVLSPGPYNVDKNDVVWKQQQVYASVHEAKVADMKHALARVKILLKRDDAADTTIPDRYTGTGSVTSVSLDNGAAASGTPVVFTTGKLDLSFVQPASPVTGVTAGAVEDKTAFTLSTTGHTTDLLTLPVTAMAKDLVTLNIVVDGKTMTQSFPSASPAEKWEAGTCYVYTVTVKNAGVTFDKVVTTQWETGNAIEGDLDVRTVVGAYKDGGIVFWVDPDDVTHYKVVSLDERNLTWNEADIWATAYGAGWYLPTEDELTTLYNARNSNGGIGTSFVDRGIAGNGGMVFGTGEYWSATEDGSDNSKMRTINLSNGNTVTSPKTESHNARAVKEVPINLSKNGTANCYITSGANSCYVFNATVMGNGINCDGSVLPAISGATSAEVIWQTNKIIEPGTVRFKNSKIYFTMAQGFNPSDGGSALIALYSGANATGSVLWSWHIWVTDYRPDAIVKANTISGQNKFYTTANIPGQVHTYGDNYWTTCPNKAIMDRNLGAEQALYDFAVNGNVNWPTFGLFYQWGRKDPFPGAALGVSGDNGKIRPLYKADGTNSYSMPGSSGGPVSIDLAIANPERYYGYGGNWTTQNDNLWYSSAEGGKTAYDPCPPGWRVAPLGVWSDFTRGGTCVKSSAWTAATDLKGGWLYSAGNVRAWYPVSGSRGSSDGALYEVAVAGSSWAATIASDSPVTDAPRLRVALNELAFSRNTFRAGACPVRCVQDKQ